MCLLEGKGFRAVIDCGPYRERNLKRNSGLLMESTYGNHNHKDNATIPSDLADMINKTDSTGGNIVIRSLAVSAPRNCSITSRGCCETIRFQYSLFICSHVKTGI